jgi:hypothetical protein
VTSENLWFAREIRSKVEDGKIRCGNRKRSV